MRNLGTKSFGSFEIKSEERGEVTAIVATLDVVDKDGDVIMPGAFPEGGAKVKLSGYGHDVILQDAPPVGVGTIYEESGKAIFEGRFFLSTDRGREAFATVKELGTDGEWSFGFPNATTKTAKMTENWRNKGARRLISALQPIEASPVFIGAGQGTMTMHTKAADSLSDRLEAVQEALYARNRTIPEEDTETPRWWAREVFEDHVIVEAALMLLRVEYTLEESGEVVLGEASEVEIVYQAVKSEESEVEAKDVAEEVVEPPVAEEAPDIGGEERLKARARHVIEEYERVSRTLRRLGVG